MGNKIMFQNPNVLLDFSNYGPVDDWNQVTVKRAVSAPSL